MAFSVPAAWDGHRAKPGRPPCHLRTPGVAQPPQHIRKQDSAVPKAPCRGSRAPQGLLAACRARDTGRQKTGDPRTQQLRLCRRSDFCRVQVLFLAVKPQPPLEGNVSCGFAYPFPTPISRPTQISRDRNINYSGQKVWKAEQAFPWRAGTKLLCSKQEDLPPSPRSVILLCSDHVWFHAQLCRDRRATATPCAAAHAAQQVCKSSRPSPC